MDVERVQQAYASVRLPPQNIDGVLAEFRRAITPDGALVVGFFDGDKVAPSTTRSLPPTADPPDELSRWLRRAGFTEVERLRRPGDDTQRPQAAIAAELTA